MLKHLPWSLLLLPLLGSSAAQEGSVATAIQNLRSGTVALPEPASYARGESCAEAIAEALNGEVPEGEGEPSLDCYLIPADEDDFPELIFDLTQNFRAEGYRLDAEVSNERLTNQLWFDRQSRSSADVSYWFGYEEGLLVSVLVKGPEE